MSKKSGLQNIKILSLSIFALVVIVGVSSMYTGIAKGTLYSDCAVLIDLNNNTVIMEKNKDAITYPASLTKIMTSIVAIENIHDMNQKVIVTGTIFPELSKQEASMAGFLPGEKVTCTDLLYGNMLPSGAECSLVLAFSAAGSEAEFVEMMNQKAREIGMLNTHFSNTSGLHDQNHYTTAHDMALLLEYALKNDLFKEVFTSMTYTIPPNGQHKDGMTFSNTMFKNLDSMNFNGGKLLGGKTGFTDEAGLCLATLAEVENSEYIFITMGADGNHGTHQYNIIDALNMYERLYEDFM